MDDLQLRLLTTENPLKTRFDGVFFKQIPTRPGIYWMVDERDEVLYVGKAKDLRARLRSYRNTSFEKLPSKTRKLLRRVSRIHWDPAASEIEALLRENELLRTLKPPFNRVGTQPETYLYFGYRPTDEGLELRLMFHLRDAPADLKIHGAFRGITRVMPAYAATLRWLWARMHENCRWPHPLARNTAPARVTIPWPVGDDASIRREQCLLYLELFLSGLLSLPEFVVPEEEPTQFLQGIWLRDQVLLSAFFEWSAKSLRTLQRDFGLEGRLLAQEALDDLVVLRRRRNALKEPPATSSEPDHIQHSLADWLMKSECV